VGTRSVVWWNARTLEYHLLHNLFLKMLIVLLKQSRYTPWRRLGERRYSFHTFSTLALDGGEWSALFPGRALAPGKDRRYPLYRRLGGPQSRSGHRE
jgi:hypothetical protein